MNDPRRGLLKKSQHVTWDQLEQIFEERMAAVTAGVEQGLAESLARARTELAGKLNQAVRRLRRALGDEWGDTLVEAAQGFCGRAALFTITNGYLHLQTSRNMADAGPADGVLLASAPAFASAVETKDTVVAMRTKGEMSEAIASRIGEAESQRFYLFPIVAREGIAAVLYADADDRKLDTNALELLATVTGAVMEIREPASEQRADLVTISGIGQKPAISAWFSLSPEEQDLHSRAQRFARVQVAEMRLYQSENVKKGRTARNLYASLKTEIDSAREGFRRDFLSEPGTMVDYLHLELVHTLANANAELLGPEYPGPLL